jgi:SAM-dependent methyltransferase
MNLKSWIPGGPMLGGHRDPGSESHSASVNRLAHLQPWLDVLGCPDCVWSPEARHVGVLSLTSDGLVCSGCGRKYPVIDGVPHLIGSHDLPETWNHQVAYFDTQVDSGFELGRPEAGGRLYNYLIRYKVGVALSALGRSLTGTRVVEACCGSGMVSGVAAEMSEDIRVLGFDASPLAIQRACLRAQLRGYQFAGVVGDAQYPPLMRGTDVTVFTHDALHHLDHPLDALKRLATVGRDLVVMEPQESLVTRLGVLLGISTNMEEAGNRVMRMQPREVKKAALAVGREVDSWRRYVMYYPHQPGVSFRRLDNPFLFLVTRIGFGALNATVGKVFGNKCHFVIRQRQSHGPFLAGSSRIRP